ncbi:ankyrin repeat domain-containing protein 39-like [Gigantopelta aegis]|uniref:ankyrin repeat domain-containing protein 39-like n=1 Tax=Gigantopelta aegis TaxID=1735272 RepID=UPI001B88CFFC|nr:ankyrin repeat domain-containing protein 39-like [Gigantopelta aegis]
MADEDVSVLRDLQSQLKVAKIPSERLSTLAQQGDLKLVEEFLSESIKVEKSGSDAIQSQLYIASFWGIKDVVRQLLANGADPNKQNRGTQWTPLHAATFQEHGPVVMVLLEHGASPEIEDSEGRTPRDFASASDKIWPHFAALDLKRTPKIELVEKGVIRRIDKVQSQKDGPGGIRMAAYSRPQSAYAYNSDPFILAASTGDVLADDNETKPRPAYLKAPFALWQ